MAENNLNLSEELLTNATKFINEAKDSYDNISYNANVLDKPNKLLNETIEIKFSNLLDIEAKLPEIQDHAANLSRRAEELVNIFTETEGTAENALKAANAYNDIGTAIQEAHQAAESSNDYVENAVKLYTDIQDDISNTTMTSANILDDADEASRNIDELKPKLKEAEVKSRTERSVHSDNDIRLNNIKKFIKNFDSQGFNDILKEAIDTTEKADIQSKRRKIDKYNDVSK